MHRNLTRVNVVSHKKIVDVDVSGPLAAGSPAILFQENSTLVVLVDSRVGDLEALGLQKVTCPEDLGHHIIYTDQFGLG